MRFYDRQIELSQLHRLQESTGTASRLTVITGRRRIGKTRLIREFCGRFESLYFFVSRKSEELLCEEYWGYINETLKLSAYGKITKLIDLFRLLFDYSVNKSLIVVIDEFQELQQVNPAFYSEFQHLWDSKKDDTHLHLIISGSAYSLMQKIFTDYRQPLFGRADLLINLKAFPITTLKEILEDSQAFSADNLLANYMLTGGVPRYLEIVQAAGAHTRENLIDHVFSEYSVFADEGKNLLIEEFGRDYSTYFTILELIATGKTSRMMIESILETSVGGYLERLENVHSLITQFRSFHSKKGSRSAKYKINDPFLSFWFAYFHRYRSAVEASNPGYVKERFKADYQQFAGQSLERLYREIFKQSGLYNLVGSYWESGFQNEIDLVAINEPKKLLILAEIKLNKKNIRKEELKAKSSQLCKLYPDFKIEYRYLGLEDLADYV
ncbi:MAG TPA: ATP-binding protein [Candidatus Cloacimonadota bacterium]|nr:ATP-binding protein [Candidatus Cloacimonadota bacterium]